MKKILYILFIIPLISLGQVPQGVNYQAVAYDANGFEIKNQDISVRLGILLGEVDAEPSYTEVHSVTTDDFGLFSLVISQGETSDTFSSINWEEGAYLKVEVDEDLDGEYSIMGVSSFNAVPYALSAPTNDLILSRLNELDSLIQLHEYNFELLTNTPQSALDNGYSPFELLNVGYTEEELYGLEYEGGLIFYLDKLKNYGLISSHEDLGEYEWGCYNVNLDANNYSMLGSGLNNTILIDSLCSPSNLYNEYSNFTAAQATMNFINDGYDDWYLPSLEEHILLYENISGWGWDNNFTSSQYWTSTHHNITHSVTKNGGNDGIINTLKYHGHKVRAIRAFGSQSFGCIDEIACNFNISATTMDNSCLYPVDGYDCEDNWIGFEIGQEVFGGIIFYIDGSGEHGLVVSKQDMDPWINWGCNGIILFDSQSSSVGLGLENTITIVDNCSNETAAYYCYNYLDGGFDDWYLPSIDELILVRDVIYNDYNVTNYDYWSSSEQLGSFLNAWALNLSEADSSPLTKPKSSSIRVRAIRSF